ncbi:MAG TPA: hypothetical protein VFZ95_02910 [Steroidobacteraceae bacterium]
MKLTTAALACALSMLGFTAIAQPQPFSSGSTGADGPLNITTANNTITVRPGGVYHHTTVTISGSLQYLRGTDNSPVVILATGDVNISGTLAVNGNTGLINGGATVAVGATGGPGGFTGGNGGLAGAPSGNVPATAGHGPAGGAPGVAPAGGSGGTYGAPASFVALTPLFGGSGGGGGVGGPVGGTSTGASGGGGGGAVLIASSTRIVLNGAIRANGGNTVFNNNTATCANFAGPGAGGAIRLVAPEIIGTGSLQAIRGTGGCNGAPPGDGRVRLEANAPIGFSGVSTPVASVATAPGAVSPGGSPALGNVPTIAIASVGGLSVPVTPQASYFTPDLALPAGTANPVPVVVAATNTPVGGTTAITLKLIAQSPGTTTNIAVPAANHTGSFTSSSAIVNVNLPAGQVSVLQAVAAMTLTGQVARLFPLIDGEPVERVMVAASAGQPSTLSLVTKSGKERRLDEMPLGDQLRVAQAWATLGQ